MEAYTKLVGCKIRVGSGKWKICKWTKVKFLMRSQLSRIVMNFHCTHHSLLIQIRFSFDGTLLTDASVIYLSFGTILSKNKDGETKNSHSCNGLTHWIGLEVVMLIVELVGWG